jgi:hypothetical protein
VFNQLDLIAALQAGSYLQRPTAAMRGEGFGENLAKDLPAHQDTLVDAALIEGWL